MASSKVRIGVIGTGFARRTQLPVLTSLAGARVTAVASGHRENAESTARDFGIAHVAPTWQELVARDDVDLVVVTTPPHLHHPIALAALHAGKHVLCEKPLALNASEAEEMARSAEGAHVLNVVDHQLRFEPNRAKFRRLIGEGYCGHVLYLRVHWAYDARASPDQAWSWWSDDEKGGGILGAVGSHAIDFIRWTFGEVAGVVARLHTFVATRPDPASGKRRAVGTDDYASLLLSVQPPAGPTIEAAVTLAAVAVERDECWEAIGDRGVLRLDASGKLVGRRRGEEPRDFSEPSGVPAVRGLPDNIWAHGFYHLASAMVRAILAREGEVAGAATFRDGWRVQQIIDAARIAESEGRFLGTGAWRPAMA